MILVVPRDPRLITVRRGGLLTDEHHRLLAVWAALCAEHVLHFFEEEKPGDVRPREALVKIRAWIRGDVLMTESRSAGGHAMAAARNLSGPGRFAALAAGQAAVVAHVAAHELGAAAYAIRCVQAASSGNGKAEAVRRENTWQRDRLPEKIRDLVLDDERLRNYACWNVFEVKRRTDSPDP